MLVEKYRGDWRGGYHNINVRIEQIKCYHAHYIIYLSLDVSEQQCLHPLHWLYEVGAAARRGRAAAAVVHGNHGGQVGPQLG